MRLKLFFWINGKAMNQEESAEPEVLVLKFGLVGTGCPQLIKRAIENARSKY
jgi:hypothetical protein